MNNSDAFADYKSADCKSADCKSADCKSTDSIRRRIAHMLGHFGCQDALAWPEAHPIDIDSLQLVELALHIEAGFDIDFRDDLIPPAATLGDFVDMVEAALRQKAVDLQPKCVSTKSASGTSEADSVSGSADTRLARPAANDIKKEVLS